MTDQTKLTQYFEGIRKILLDKYEISKISEHSVVIGTLRESFINNFIKSSLPLFVGTESSVEIIDSQDNSSGEVDIVVYNPYSFKIPIGDSNSILSNDSTICAFEIKSTMDNKDFVKSLNKAMLVKQLHRENKIQGIERTTVDGKRIVLEQDSTTVVVVAFTGTKLSTLSKYVNDYEKDLLPDIIINLSNSEILIKNDGFLFPLIPEDDSIYQYRTDNSLLVFLWHYLYLLVDAIRRNMDNGGMDVNKYLS